VLIRPEGGGRLLVCLEPHTKGVVVYELEGRRRMDGGWAPEAVDAIIIISLGPRGHAQLGYPSRIRGILSLFDRAAKHRGG
jgi:hypothetical protein